MRPFARTSPRDGLKRRRIGSRVEILESRQLLSGAVSEIPLTMTLSGQYNGATPANGPLTLGPDGNFWFTEGFNTIARVTPSGTLAEFSFPSTHIASILGTPVNGPDGALWFTEGRSSAGVAYGAIARVSTSGVLTEYPLPAGTSPGSLTLGADGNLWFPEYRGSNSSGTLNPPGVARISPSGVITEFPLPSGSGNIGPLTLAADGDLWFTELPGLIGRVTPSGNVTTYPAPVQESNLTAGPDGNLWFFADNNAIGRISTSGAVATFPLPVGTTFSALTITDGSDGNLWLPVSLTGGLPGVARITPTGAVTVFNSVVTVPGDSTTTGSLTAAPNGDLDFLVHVFQFVNIGQGFTSETNVGDFLEQVSPSGTIIATPSLMKSPVGPSLTLGLNGTLSILEGDPGSPYLLATLDPSKINPSQIIDLTAPTFSPVAGVATAISYATFRSTSSTGSPADFQATVSFGDGQTAPGLIFETAGVFAVTVAHSYARPGTYPVTVTINGPGGAVATSSYPILVSSSAPVLTAVPTLATVGFPVTATYATFASPYPAATAADFAATVVFSDGQVAPGVVTGPVGGSFSVSATYTYVKPGSYPVTVFVTSPGGVPSTAIDRATVLPAPVVAILKRTGIHDQPTQLILTFNRPMNAATVQDLRNYVRYPIGPNGYGGRFPRPIPITSAVYDPVHRTVTLTPASRLPLGGYSLLTVSGVGPHPVRDANGDPLTGTGTGSRPGDFIAIIHGSGLTVTTPSTAKVRTEAVRAAGPRPLASSAVSSRK